VGIYAGFVGENVNAVSQSAQRSDDSFNMGIETGQAIDAGQVPGGENRQRPFHGHPATLQQGAEQAVGAMAQSAANAGKLRWLQAQGKERFLNSRADILQGVKEGAV